MELKRFSKSLLAIMAIVVMAITTNSSIAYFTSKDRAENIYTVGKIAIRLDEPKWNPNEEHFVTANAVYDKDPIVTNIGNNDAYVRIVLTMSDYAVFQAHGGASYDLLSMLNVNSKWVLTKGPTTDGDDVKYVYTYSEILPVNGVTDPLFTIVTLPSFIDAQMISELNGKFDIKLQANAIQAEGFSNYSEAFTAYEEQIGG